MDFMDFAARLKGGFSPSQRKTAWRRIGNYVGKESVKLAKSKLGNSQHEIGPYPRWPELSPVTIEDKIARGLPVPSPLLREGELRDSISYEITTLTATNVVVDVSAEVEYGEFQELGTLDMPPRPFLQPAVWEIVNTDLEAIADVILAECIPGYPAGFKAEKIK